MLKNLEKVFLILIGSLAWSLTMVKSGLRYDYGVGFWGPNGHDGVWHISLAKALASGSTEMPIFAGETIKNYHLGFDLLLALVNRITSIPISVLYFQIFPPIAAVLIGLLTYRFVLTWKKSQSAAFWSTFFVYFGGNAAWILGKGESTFWAQPAILTLINPPFALSLIIILIGLNLLIKPKKIFLVAPLFGLLIQIKAYAGLIILFSLLITAVYEYSRKRALSYFKMFLVTLGISLVLFMPNLSSGSLLEVRPFWFLETMMAFPDRVGWAKFGEAMVNYRLVGNWLKTGVAYAVAFLIFWYGNLGTRFINEFYWVRFIRKRKKLESLDIFLGSAVLIGLVTSLLFVQKGTAWNTIQFFYYSLFFISIISGIVFAKIKTNLLIVGMIIFTLPTTVGVLKHYLPSRPPAMIPNFELEALEFLSKQPKGVVLVMPFDRRAAEESADNPPRPLYLYESTAYISAYTGQSVWLEDEVNLDITGYDWQSRRERLLNVLQSGQEDKLRNFLGDEHVSYVYVVDKSNKSEFGNLLFENEEVDIYKI